MVFPVVVYGCECWTIKKAECQRIDAFELCCWRRLESSLDCKEIQSVHPNGDQSLVFIGRTDVEAETPIFGHLMLSADLLKRLWCWERLRAGGEGADRGWDGGWHHSLNGYEFEWTPGVGDGQGGLVCCSQWGRKESDTTERLNWTELCFPAVYSNIWSHKVKYFSRVNCLDISWPSKNKISIVHLKIVFFCIYKPYLQHNTLWYEPSRYWINFYLYWLSLYLKK